MSAELFIGIMSGTSLDGADAVLAQFANAVDPDQSIKILAHRHQTFTPELYEELVALQQPGANELHRAALVENALANHYAGLVNNILTNSRIPAQSIQAIGVHGQTVRHRPDLSYTVQLNAPARLAELTQIDVIADFRSRDIAAGGQGAPLVPAFHAQVFASAKYHRIVLNIGGIANVTDLPTDANKPVRGWDTGPGNVLLDTWIQYQRGVKFDAQGAWAATGQVLPELLQALLSEDWFAFAPPKSSGRDLFNPQWLKRHLQANSYAAVDVQATLAQLTATSIARSLAAHSIAPDEILVCGGGAYNIDLLKRLALELRSLFKKNMLLRPCSSEVDIQPEQVEALAFAWLAWQFKQRRPGNLPAVTGARGLRILGACYPA